MRDRGFFGMKIPKDWGGALPSYHPIPKEWDGNPYPKLRLRLKLKLRLRVRVRSARVLSPARYLRRRRPTPSRLPARPLPRIVCPPFHSAGLGFSTHCVSSVLAKLGR